MGGGLHGPQLCLGIEHAVYEQGLGDPVLEFVGQGVVGHAVGVVDDLALPGPGEDIGAQPGGHALDELSHVYGEDLGAGVEEAEVQLLVSPLIGKVALLVYAQALGHLCRGQALDGAQLPDPVHDLPDLEFQRIGHFHGIFLRTEK